jgi:hypothetical protein
LLGIQQSSSGIQAGSQPSSLDAMPRLSSALRPFAVGALLCCTLARADTQPELNKIADTAVWRVRNRTATLIERDGHHAIHLDAKPGDGFAWLLGSAFADGTIDIDLRGANKPGQSFVGIAFHGRDDTTFAAVYFRPFNFNNPEIPRRARAVQYISHPQFTWEKLRAEFPGKYEHAVSPVPDPDHWFHARIVIQEHQVSVYVDDATTPSLVVTQLSDRRDGLVGLWVGNGSAGDFTNLKITAR